MKRWLSVAMIVIIIGMRHLTCSEAAWVKGIWPCWMAARRPETFWCCSSSRRRSAPPVLAAENPRRRHDWRSSAMAAYWLNGWPSHGGKRWGRAADCVCRLLIVGRACGSALFIFMSQMVHVVLFMNKLVVENTSVSSPASACNCTATDEPNFHWEQLFFFFSPLTLNVLL